MWVLVSRILLSLVAINTINSINIHHCTSIINLFGQEKGYPDLFGRVAYRTHLAGSTCFNSLHSNHEVVILCMHAGFFMHVQNLISLLMI